LRQMGQDGIEKAIGFITAAHRTEASLQRYMRAVEAAQQKIGPMAPVIEYVDAWFDHPLFIEATCERIQEVLHGDGETERRGDGEPQPSATQVAPSPGRPVTPPEDAWIFTAHSIPSPMAAESNYVGELCRTAERVCEKMRREEWSLAYSSRSGRPEDPWLEPDICAAIREKAADGIKEILVVPIGFVADHVEVLFDLDVEAKEAAKKAGVRLKRAGTVGEHPKFFTMMADVVRARLRALAASA
jgi:protoporphyrin/coproporphyrin ferrochelatase